MKKNLEGLAVGDNFTFGLTADEGYGKHDQEAIVNLDKKIFEVEEKTDKELLQAGNIIPMQNEQGHHLNYKVLKIVDEKVTIDFNHPLAGQNIHFNGEILDVRAATKEELDHGQIDAHH